MKGDGQATDEDEEYRREYDEIARWHARAGHRPFTCVLHSADIGVQDAAVDVILNEWSNYTNLLRARF